MVKKLPATQETWVGKILWRRERPPTPVFLQYSYARGWALTFEDQRPQLSKGAPGPSQLTSVSYLYPQTGPTCQRGEWKGRSRVL